MKKGASKDKGIYQPIFIAVFLASIVILLGCPQLRGSPDRHIHREVKPSELTGTWQATNASLERIIHEGYSLYTAPKEQCFTLFKDGTCEFNGYPWYLYNPAAQEQKKDYMRSMTGRWTIAKESTWVLHRSVEVPALQIDIETKEGNITGSIIITLFIVEEKGNIILWEYIGDPDYLTYMDFAKVP
jgi:hypothetical protein